MQKTLLLILFVFKSGLFYAQEPPLAFMHLKTQDGLSQSWVKCICQDYQGFMWFGTNDGLNKYDGYDFTVYKHDPKNKNTISNSEILSILEDRKGNLWVGTLRGLNLYDRNNDRFLRNSKWPQNQILDIAELNDGRLLIAVLALGLVLFDPNTNNSMSFVRDDLNPTGLNSNNLTEIVIDHNKNIWIGTSDRGLILFNLKDQTFTHFSHNNNDKNSIDDNNIRSLYVDPKGRVWLGTGNSGLILLTYEKGQPEKPVFINFKHNATDKNSISNGTIYAILQDNHGYLWIGAENEGLNILDLNSFNEKNGFFYHFKNDPFYDKSISGNSVHSLYKDNQGSIWAGTFSGGLNMYNPLATKFICYRQELNNKKSLSNNSVNVFFEDGNSVWIGTEGGLNLFNEKDQSCKHFIHDPSDERSIGSNAVWTILKDSRDNLWIGTWAGGLNLFNPDEGTFTRYKYDLKNKNGIGSDNVFSILEDRDRDLWVGTMGGGLNLFNYNTKSFKKYVSEQTDRYSIADDWIRTLFQTSNGEIWLTASTTVDLFNKEKGIFKHFRHDTADITSISYSGANIFFEDSKKNLWLGTNGGLNLYNRSDSSFIYYLERDGLPGNQILGILEDNHGNLWISTNKGIAKFINGINHPQLPEFITYGKSDGLQDNEFKSRSCLKTKDGKMYFGGINGFNAFYPDSIHENPFVPQVVLTNFLLFNKPVEIGVEGSPLKKHIGVCSEITLSYRHSMISIEYAALNYILPEKNQYKYMLEGFDEEWHEVGTKREAIFTNLDPGKYIFRVIGSNNDGVWNMQGASLKITILPPWWKTIWFRLLAMLVGIGSAIGFYFYRVNNLQRQKLLLEKSVKERTKEVENKNEELSQQAVVMNEANILLKEKQFTIEKQSNVLKSQTEELKEVNEHLKTLNTTKDKFFSIIAHDLKNPFTSILGFSELLTINFEKIAEDKKRRYANVIYEASSAVFNLLENLLQWSRSQTNRLKFEPAMLDIHQIITENVSLVKEMLRHKNISAIIKNDQSVKLIADKNMLNTIMRNLLSNAIKFSKRESEISIDYMINNGWIQVSIGDSGVGMSEKELEGLFKIESSSSRQGTEGETGTGLGLLLCKEFVEKHKGKIWVESEFGKGTTFTFSLPLT